MDQRNFIGYQLPTWRTWLLLGCSILYGTGLEEYAQGGPLDIMSFNIRFDKGTDGKNNWGYAPDPRREKVFTTIENYNPDIFGIQEGFENQVAELKARFPDYGYVGEQASIESSMPGEHSGLFFRDSRFTLIDEGTFWFSNTPDVPGTFFPSAAGSSSTRSTSWARLFDHEENQEIAVMSVHFYSNSATPRIQSANLMRDRMESLFGDMPLILMGDFNADEDTTEMQIMHGNNDPGGYRILDSYREVYPTVMPSIEGTTHSFSGNINGVRKDFVLYNNRFQATEAAIDHTHFGSPASYPSDHFPVTATLIPTTIRSVLPTAETTPSVHGSESVDDAAIWYDANNPSNSFIIGADKNTNGRLDLYNIIQPSGLANTSLFKTVGSGAMNNVDLRYGFNLGGNEVDLVVASNRTTDQLSIFRVDPTARTLVEVTGSTATGMDPYGLTLYQSADGSLYAFASDRNSSQVKQFQLLDNGSNGVNATLVRTITMGGLVEGMVVDDANDIIYIGEEDTGIFRFDAKPSSGNVGTSSGVTVDLVGGSLVADIEGLSLYDDGNGGGYLIASSQGDNTYSIYDRKGTNAFITRFTIDDNIDAGIDGAQDTDGIDVSSHAFGTAFPNGFLIVQDGENPGAGDNYKLVPWEIIQSIILSARPEADFDNDGDVDGSDFLAWQVGFGTTNSTHAEGDANGNHVINAADLIYWMQQYGDSQPANDLGSSGVVPEPDGRFLLVFLLLTLFLCPYRMHHFSG